VYRKYLYRDFFINGWTWELVDVCIFFQIHVAWMSQWHPKKSMQKSMEILFQLRCAVHINSVNFFVQRSRFSQFKFLHKIQRAIHQQAGWEATADTICPRQINRAKILAYVEKTPGQLGGQLKIDRPLDSYSKSFSCR